ncbi:glycosyltransferase family 4 protein [Geminicoccaceae bacterium 1502E]|nr:glycosyltransferase family 4 protein [Geminicoccaceae bacterium 1502E]
MRILYHHRVRSKDGQFVHIDAMVGALRELGHEVLLVGPAATAQAAFGEDAGAVARLKRLLPRALYETAELGYGLAASRRLLRACRRFRPDVLYERYNLHFPAGALVARRLGLPLLLEVNAPLAAERGRHDGLGLPALARRSEGAIWRAADRVLVVTDVLGRMVEAEGVPARRIVTIPNGIDATRYREPPEGSEARRRLGLEGRLLLGFVGFVRAWHGLDRVLDWLAQRPDAMLSIVGDGPARPELERQAEALGIAGRVRWHGIVEPEQVPAHVAAFDIALQPEVVAYASPLKLFDYMALGRAIVAPDSPNIREILRDESNALLVSGDGLGLALDRLAGDAALRARLGMAAAATIRERDLTWQGNARRVAALAAELAGAG